MSVVMGVDSSTQACRVELRDADTGAYLGSGSSLHPVTTPPVSEQNPADWWLAMTLAMNWAVAASGVDKKDIKAISVAAQPQGLVLLDPMGRVLRPVKLWDDLTSTREANVMANDGGITFWVNTVGSVPTAAFTVSKLAWMARHEPETLSKAARACLPHDWLTWRLTGDFVTDRSDASGTGYYAAWKSAYLPEVLQRFGRVSNLELPTVLGPDTRAGRISSRAAAELGLGTDVVVGPGAGDQQAAALGMGLTPGDVAFSIDTSAVVMTVSETPVHDAAGIIDGVCDATGRYLPLVCSLNGLKVTDWFRSLLGLDTARFEALALAVPPRERTLTLAAFFDGERRPNLPYATGVLAGLRTDTTPAQIARASFDGVVMGLLAGVEAMQHCGIDVGRRAIVVGSGASSAAYRQSLADLLKRPVVTLGTPDATVRGACLQAACVLAGAKIDHLRDTWRPPKGQTTEPGAPVADETMEAYRKLAAFRGTDRVRTLS